MHKEYPTIWRMPSLPAAESKYGTSQAMKGQRFRGWLWDPVRVTHGVRMCWFHSRMEGLGVEGYVPPLRAGLTPFPRVKPMLIPWNALSNPRVGRVSLLGRVASLLMTRRLVQLTVRGTEIRLLFSWTNWQGVIAPMLGWKDELEEAEW